MTTEARPDWMQDWIPDPAAPPVGERPLWQKDIDQAIVSGDRALEDLYRPDTLRLMSKADRIALAAAQYQRATAAALVEIAMFAEPNADTLTEIKGVLEMTQERVESIASDMIDVGDAVTRRRRWWLLWIA